MNTYAIASNFHSDSREIGDLNKFSFTLFDCKKFARRSR